MKKKRKINKIINYERCVYYKEATEARTHRTKLAARLMTGLLKFNTYGSGIMRQLFDKSYSGIKAKEQEDKEQKKREEVVNKLRGIVKVHTKLMNRSRSKLNRLGVKVKNLALLN